MKTEQFIPTNSSLKTGMLCINEKGAKSIILIDGHAGEFGRVSGETWFPIYHDDKCFKDTCYFQEIWSEHHSNRNALDLSTEGRKLLWRAEPAIKIGDYKVEFNKDHIKVGCTSVSHETVKQIYDKIFNE